MSMDVAGAARGCSGEALRTSNQGLARKVAGLCCGMKQSKARPEDVS